MMFQKESRTKEVILTHNRLNSIRQITLEPFISTIPLPDVPFIVLLFQNF